MEQHVTEGLAQTALRGVDTHGVRLLPHYVAELKAGRINPKPTFVFRTTSLSTGLFDADHSFGHAACIEASKRAVEMAKESGSGHVAVFNSTHCGAAACSTLAIAKQGMIGMCFLHADALMRTHSAKTAFLGTNPISFAAPCEGEEPFCLDMSTTLTNFNKIRKLREEKRLTPETVGANCEGVETRNPDEITMLLPIGGYKGFGLSLMVEILCSMLTGMPYGHELTPMYTETLSEKRFLAQHVTALRVDCFQEISVFKRRMSMLLNDLRNQPPLDPSNPVQVPGDPEKKAVLERMHKGIPLSPSEYEAFRALAIEYDVPLPV